MVASGWWEESLAGLGIGLAAGASPGPLLVLVVTTTLRDGLRSGVVASAAPLVSDVVVVSVVLATLGRLPVGWLSWLGVVGGLAVVAVGLSTVRESRTASLAGGAESSARPVLGGLGRAALVNLLSPHPWLTWVTVLGPLTLSAARDSLPAGVGVVVLFYVGLVGAKAVLAVLVSRGRHRLGPTAYRRVVLGAGLVLVVLGLAMLAEFGSAVV